MTVMSERGIWVYAVAECGAGAMLPGFPGVAGQEVRLAAAGDLTAVVSDVDLAEFGPEALHRNLEDLDWLEEVARAHHGVIDTAGRLFTVLPMRLATVYTCEEIMAVSLRGHRPAFEAGLRRVRARTEWGVKAYVTQPHLPDRDAAGSSPAERAERAGRSGVSYLRRRREALSARQDSWRGAAESAEAAHAELGRYAADCCLHAPQSPQLSGRTEAMVLNAAYLLDNDLAGPFAEAVAAMGARDPRLRLELTGPWPPYSFALPDAGQVGA